MLNTKRNLPNYLIHLFRIIDQIMERTDCTAQNLHSRSVQIQIQIEKKGKFRQESVVKMFH